MRDRVEARVSEAPAARPPRRANLFPRFLPSDHTVFSLVSELGSHPGPLANVAFSEGRPEEKDLVFWASVTYATFVSVLGEIASALDHEDWIVELDEVLKDADPVIGVAWPKTRHPNAWQERQPEGAPPGEDSSDPP